DQSDLVHGQAARAERWLLRCGSGPRFLEKECRGRSRCHAALQVGRVNASPSRFARWGRLSANLLEPPERERLSKCPRLTRTSRALEVSVQLRREAARFALHDAGGKSVTRARLRRWNNIRTYSNSRRSRRK